MSVYTVTRLSKISGVTIRTLRWYDEIGLLKPAYYGDNGYRYYEKEQLLRLQQILFFKSLGVGLKEIETLLCSESFSQQEALLEHKAQLKLQSAKIHLMLKTVDSTLKHLNGEENMKDEQLYDGLKEWSENRNSESFYIGKYDSDDSGDEAMKIILESGKSPDLTKEWTPEDWDEHVASLSRVYEDVVSCFNKGLEVRSDPVQCAIEKHYQKLSQFHVMSQEVYLAYSEVYLYKKEFRDQLDSFHPELHSYLSKAMKVFVYNGTWC